MVDIVELRPVEERRLREFRYLGCWLSGARAPNAIPPAARVADRKHDPAAETGRQSAAAITGQTDKTGLDQLLALREAFGDEMVEQHGAGVGREADPEPVAN